MKNGNENSGDMNWSAFHNYLVIKRFLKRKQTENKKTTRILKIGKTAQNRDMYAVVIGNGAGKIARLYKKNRKKMAKQSRRSFYRRRRKERQEQIAKPREKKLAPIVMIEAGAHAREWISLAVSTYLIEQLVKESPDFLKMATWIIVPVANPDGYEYSFSTDRLWRKNMNDFETFSSCFGVDLNRNYELAWGGDGSSGDACDEIYRGENSFSERETQNIRNLFQVYAGSVKVFLSIHNYGQFILFPWGYDEEKSTHKRKLTQTAERMSECIESSRGTKYEIGQSSSLLYVSSGTIDDWMHNNDVDLSFTIELPDEWKNGFLTPSEEILPICEETYPAIRCLAFKAAKKEGDAKECFSSC
ncbi:carboxypeptidase B-like [Oratosquilla oratoria]|uniref:carboxypeptidase B-like n=1 Tax=Oratosquilla oratoria TaxID=337810 RepID=UPI003F766203